MRLDRIDHAILQHLQQDGRATSAAVRVVAPDLGAYEEFLRTRLTRIPGVQKVQSAFALKRVAYRTSLPLRR